MIYASSALPKNHSIQEESLLCERITPAAGMVLCDQGNHAQQAGELRDSCALSGI
jgi:hypothetical protein